MTQNNQNTEVIEVDAEEIPLEEVIDKTLVKHNVTNAIITSLKEKYGELRLRDVEDKENYIEIKAARKEVRKYGILTEKICEEGRSAAIKIQRLWLSKQSEILAKIGEVQNPLDAEIEKFENEVERKELIEQKRQQQVYMNRQATLMKYGAQYNNGSLELNHISYEISLIKEADEEQWNDTIFPKYRKVYEEIEATKVAEENKRKEQLAQEKREREEFELHQKKFREEQEAFAEKQKELRKAQDEYELQQRERRQSIINDRETQLRRLGMTYNHIYNNYSFEDIVGDVSKFETEKQWNEWIEKITPEIQVKKDEEEKRKIAFQEKIKEAAIKQAIEDQKLKEQKEQAKKEEELAQANDKTKFAEIISQFQEIKIHEMKSPLYKRKVQMIREKLGEIYSL